MASISPLIAKAIDDDIAAGGSESFSGGQPETLRRSSDERALSLEHVGR